MQTETVTEPAVVIENLKVYQVSVKIAGRKYTLVFTGRTPEPQDILNGLNKVYNFQTSLDLPGVRNDIQEILENRTPFKTFNRNGFDYVYRFAGVNVIRFNVKVTEPIQL